MISAVLSRGESGGVAAQAIFHGVNLCVMALIGPAGPQVLRCSGRSCFYRPLLNDDLVRAAEAPSRARLCMSWSIYRLSS